MKEYDFIFAGGGLAGLSLAYRLAGSALRNRSMLIVDRQYKTRNDRTWCFWTDRATPFDGIVYRSWDRLRFVGTGAPQDIPLGNYRYKLIRSIDFYNLIRGSLAGLDNVRFLHGSVDGIRESGERAAVTVDGVEYCGRWVFDSRFQINRFNPGPARSHYLKQIFQGWLVETPADAFDPVAPYFMDLRTPQDGELRFFYVLPYFPRSALVEFVAQSSDRYEEALKAYLENVLGIMNYSASPIEGGVNPMTDFRFARKAGEHVMNIGTRGGRVKGSTGYAFMRIQQDSASIVDSLLRHGHPFDVPADSRRYQLYDSLMLDVMERHGDQIKSLFTDLFRNNPIERVLRFLDETASPLENALLIASLPPQLFLQSLYHLSVLPTHLNRSDVRCQHL